MVRNFLLFLLTIGAISWIIYAGMNLVNYSENSNPEKLFGMEDGRILILNRPQEIQIEETDFQLQPRLLELYGILSSTLQKGERIFVSEKKAHVLLQTTNLLSESEIISRFNEKGLVSNGAKSYKWKNFRISFFKGVLDCQIISEKSSFNKLKWFTFDKKSSCSIIEFTNKKSIVKDYYQLDESTIIYTRQPIFASTAKSFDDQALFGNFIPSTLRSYHFIEKSILAKQDPIFAKGPAIEWSNSGIVNFEYNGANFLLFDLLDGYPPSTILEKYLDTVPGIHSHFAGIQLTENFPSNKLKGFYAIELNNYLLLSNIESALSEAKVALELNQTLARYRKARNLIYSDAPQVVNERKWSNEEKKATTTYRGNSLSVQILNTKKLQQSLPSEFEVKHVALKSEVDDFIVHEKKDLLFAFSKENVLSGFLNQKNFLNMKIPNGKIGSLFWSKERTNVLLFTSTDKLYLLTETGQNVPGFPVTISGGITKDAVAFKHNGKENYLVATNDGLYHWFNEMGLLQKSGKIGIDKITAIPNVWYSAQRLFFGFRNDNIFAMVDAEKGNQLREFPLAKNAVSVCGNNAIKFFSIENNALVQIDQKGKKKMLNEVPIPIWIRPITGQNNEGFCIKNNNVISYYSADGVLKMKVKIPFESVDFIGFSNTVKKGLLLGLIDGLSNQLYLYQPNGSAISLPKNQAQKKYQINNQGDQLTIYTIIDKFVIQYVL